MEDQLQLRPIDDEATLAELFGGAELRIDSCTLGESDSLFLSLSGSSRWQYRAAVCRLRLIAGTAWWEVRIAQAGEALRAYVNGLSPARSMEDLQDLVPEVGRGEISERERVQAELLYWYGLCGVALTYSVWRVPRPGTTDEERGPALRGERVPPALAVEWTVPPTTKEGSAESWRQTRQRLLREAVLVDIPHALSWRRDLRP